MLKRLVGMVPGTTLAVGTAMFGAMTPAWAVSGHAEPGQMDFPAPATPVMREIVEFHNFVNPIIILIALFVLALLIYVMWAFSEKRNPTPSTTTHNTLLEVAWTVIPILILVAITIPSFKLLHLQYSYPKPDLTIKAIASTWYWTHEYVDADYGFSVESQMLQDDALAARHQELKAKGVADDKLPPRLLAVDNEVLVPVNKVVHVLVTSTDVIHNWTVQQFGSKIDAVPGRITSTWFQAEKEGVFYGQCSELCGKDHAYMPIAVRVVKEDLFNEWAAAKKAKDKNKLKKLNDQIVLQQSGVTSLAAAETR